MRRQPASLKVALGAGAGFLCGVLLIVVLALSSGDDAAAPTTTSRTATVAGFPTPAVVGLRLDVARERIERAASRSNAPAAACSVSSWSRTGRFSTRRLRPAPGSHTAQRSRWSSTAPDAAPRRRQALLRCAASVPLTRSCETRKVQVGSREGRPRPRRYAAHARTYRARDRREEPLAAARHRWYSPSRCHARRAPA